MNLNIERGTEKVSPKGEVPIAVINLSDETVFILEGSRGENPELDLKIKYKKSDTSQVLIPSHIHWVVDLIIKQKSKRNLTKKLIKFIYQEYENTVSLVGRDRTFETIENELNNFAKSINIKQYKSLDKYGYYNVDFILVLLKLFSIIEKTSSDSAFMFKSILKEFTKENPDYFALVAVATNVKGARLEIE